MFFIITNIIIGKCYPNIMTQVIIGTICYVISFFILKDIIPPTIIENYKYWIYVLIFIDVCFLAYLYKYHSVTKPVVESIESMESIKSIKSMTSVATTPLSSHQISTKSKFVEKHHKSSPSVRHSADVSFSLADPYDYVITNELSPDDTDLSDFAPKSVSKSKSESKSISRSVSRSVSKSQTSQNSGMSISFSLMTDKKS